MRAAQALRQASDGVFDVALGSGPWWVAHGQLHKAQGLTQLDLGGLAKGYAVDQAVRAMQRAGCVSGWVNAGGDLRVFGQARTPVMLRDETTGGVRQLGVLSHGALATSHFSGTSRSQLFAALPGGASDDGPVRHVSVVAPRCVWADALTKIVAATGNPEHPLLARLGARAWLH
jgi:thiamine biosynthesis lipoprotein